MDSQLEEISGVVDEVTYRNDDTGFTVLELECDEEYVTAVGSLPEITQGESVRLRGTWSFHATFGRQFKVQLCERSMPSSSADLLRYLSAGAVKGIGPATAKKIIDRFGDSSFDVLENDPKQLAQIKGISLKKAEEISKAFNEQFAGPIQF